MTLASQATQTPPSLAIVDDGYQAGTCNIGPAEIARRRQGAHVALGIAIVALVGLVAIDAPPVTRLLVALPVAAAASGYLQARLKFCAGFGSRGIYNFGELGQTVRVDDADARRRDKARSNQIGLASAVIGVTVGLLAVALPL